MMPVNQPAARLFALLCAVAVVTGCPGPNQEEVPPTPVKPSGKGTAKPSAKPTGSTGPSSKPSGSPSSGTSPTPSPGTSATPTTNPNATATPVGATPSPTPSATATPIGATPSPTPSATATPVGATPSPTPSATATPVGATPSPTPSPTPTPTGTPGATPTPAPTPTPTPAATATPGQAGRENAGSTTTLAGDAENQGALDGTGTGATFSLPSAVAADRNGFVWVADTGNNMIRKITSAGVVTTVAGSTQDFADGTGTAAKFNAPTGITVDDNGNVYVADTGNNRVRKIVAGTSTVTTLVGGGQGGQALNSPGSVACDRSGNLFIADTGNFRILRVPNGQTAATVFAGSGAAGISDGQGTAAQFISPVSLTVDFAGNVYVADASFIRKITSGGAVTSLNLTGAAFSQPRLTTDRQTDGSILYATDGDSHKIYTIKRDASNDYEATLLAGSTMGFLDAFGASARFKSPLQPFVTGDGTMYVPDQQNNCIRKLQ